MKTLTRHIAALALVTLAVTALTGCRHKDLYVENFDMYQVRVDFNFDEATDRPAAMRVFFYPLGDLAWHQPWRFDLRAEGGVVQVPAGDYHVLAYNVDARNVMEYGYTSYDDFLLTTGQYQVTVTEEENSQGFKSPRRTLFGSKVPIGEGEQPDFPLFDTPDWTCAARADFFHVEPEYETIGIYKKGEEQTHEVSTDVRSSLTLQARDAVKTLEFELTGIEGVQWATLLRGTISGIPTGYNMATGLPSDELGMMTFAARVDMDKEAVVGTMNVWGFSPPDDPDARQFLNVYIWANNGNHYVAQDVTVQMVEGEGTNRQRVVIHLHTTGMDLNYGGNGNSGFNPSVGEWAEQSTNIKL